MKEGPTYGWLNYNALTALSVVCVNINLLLRKEWNYGGWEGII